jgi:AraC-like DNA-binding protein
MERNGAILMVLPATPFESVPDLAQFFGDPARRYVVHRSFAYWQAERRAFGTMIWGRPNENDVVEMCAAHEVGANPLFRGHTSLVDIRALEAVDLLAFKRMLAYLRQRRDEWSPNVSRQVVLHRGGYAHAVVVGMFQLLSPSHQVLFFDDAKSAFESIGAADVYEDLEVIRQELLGTPAIVRRVQAALEGIQGKVTAGAVARSIGMSTRSLQRYLMDAGSSLRQERQKQLLRTSERLLEATELDLDAIAGQVGASSPSHLIALFRAHHGMTPGAFRALHRRS